jgi:hypothetical protein
MMEPAVQAK